MSVAVSLPGLVSQRQCKVTARRTRASRFGPLCNSPQPPFPALSPAIISPPAPPLPNCMSVSSRTYPHVAPTGSAAASRCATYFFCAAPPTPSIAAYGLFLWRQFAAQHIVTVYRTAIIVYRFTLRLWQLVLQSEGHPKPDAGGFARSPGQSERNERHPGLAPPCHPRAVSAKALKGGCVPSGR